MKKIILAGGGSGGHVTPILSIFKEIRLKKLRDPSIETIYIGRTRGIERNIFEQQVDVYYPIVAGKWRKFFSLKNIVAIFVVLRAFAQCLKHLYPHRKSSILFHTGGYVSFPPALAAFVLRIPVCLHEQTSRAGVTNKISALFARKVFCSFEGSLSFFPKRKSSWVGYPISKFFYGGPKAQRSGEEHGESFLEKVPTEKPIILVTGGGNGSTFINQLVLNALPELTQKYFVLHQVGRKHLGQIMQQTSDNYLPVGLFSPAEWSFLLKRSEIVVARAGAGTVSECIYLNKKVLFVPLEISRGKEQYYNALEAAQYIKCSIVPEKEILEKKLMHFVAELAEGRNTISSSVTERYALDAKLAKNFTRSNFKEKLTTSASQIVQYLLDEVSGNKGERGNSRRHSRHSQSSGGRYRNNRDSSGNSPQRFRRKGRPHARGGSSNEGNSRYDSDSSSQRRPAARTRNKNFDRSKSSGVVKDGVRYVENPFRDSRPKRKGSAQKDQVR